jgi:hypothetical protein
VTAHSPIGKNPHLFGIQLLPEKKLTSGQRFARNDLDFTDPIACDHHQLGEGLRKAVYNYMHGAGLELDVRTWFGKKQGKWQVPQTTVPSDLIQQALEIADPIVAIARN